MRVLVVEDFEVLAAAIGTGLRREGMAVDVVLYGDDALGHLALTRYDVVVLDRDLPGTHGDEVCRRLAAQQSPSRVLMLTAASTVAARVQGLGLGADDYLPKPFDFAELVARVRALGRRAAAPLPPTLEYRDISLDPGRRVVFRAGTTCPAASSRSRPGSPTGGRSCRSATRAGRLCPARWTGSSSRSSGSAASGPAKPTATGLACPSSVPSPAPTAP
jgi:DNA-binding response OmpR family regulator